MSRHHGPADPGNSKRCHSQREATITNIAEHVTALRAKIRRFWQRCHSARQRWVVTIVENVTAGKPVGHFLLERCHSRCEYWIVGFVKDVTPARRRHPQISWKMSRPGIVLSRRFRKRCHKQGEASVVVLPKDVTSGGPLEGPTKAPATVNVLLTKVLGN